MKCRWIIILVLIGSEAKLFKTHSNDKMIHIQKEDTKTKQQHKISNQLPDKMKRHTVGSLYTPNLPSVQASQLLLYNQLKPNHHSVNNLHYGQNLQSQLQSHLQTVNNLHYGQNLQSQLQPHLQSSNKLYYGTQLQPQLPPHHHTVNDGRYANTQKSQLQQQLHSRLSNVFHSLNIPYITNIHKIKSGLDPTWKYDGKNSSRLNPLLSNTSDSTPKLYLPNNQNIVKNGNYAQVYTGGLQNTVPSPGTLYHGHGYILPQTQTGDYTHAYIGGPLNTLSPSDKLYQGLGYSAPQTRYVPTMLYSLAS